MKNIKKTLAVLKYHVIVQIRSVKTLVVMFMLFLYIRSLLDPVNTFLEEVGVKIHPFVFPELANDFVVQVVLLLGFLVLVCDAPFMKKGYLFIVSRSGKSNFVIGQSLFLLMYSVLYTLSIWLFSVINLLKNMKWESDWGKAIMTLAKTDAGMQYDIGTGWNQVVVSNYTPIEATIKTMILFILGLWFIALVVYFMNYFLKNYTGIIAGVIIIFFDISINNVFDPSLYKFSPASLIKISVVTGIGMNPSFEYALMFLGLGCAILMAAVVIGTRMKKGLKFGDRRNQ